MNINNFHPISISKALLLAHCCLWSLKISVTSSSKWSEYNIQDQTKLHHLCTEAESVPRSALQATGCPKSVTLVRSKGLFRKFPFYFKIHIFEDTLYYHVGTLMEIITGPPRKLTLCQDVPLSKDLFPVYHLKLPG